MLENINCRSRENEEQGEKIKNDSLIKKKKEYEISPPFVHLQPLGHHLRWHLATLTPQNRPEL